MTKVLFAIGLMLILLTVSVSAMTFPNTAKVRVVHASPDAPAVDVWVNDQKTLMDIPFKDLTSYAEVPKGMYNFKVVPAGQTEPVVIEADLNLKAFKDYTVIAVDYLSTIKPIVLEDNRFMVPPKMVPIRFVHASPDAPAVDIAVKNGPVIFGNVGFSESSSYAMVKPGKYDLEVRVASTDIVALEINDVMLDSGVAYSAVAVGELSDDSLSAWLIEDREIMH